MSLIKDFESRTNRNVIEKTNEKYLLEEFILYQLNTYFDNDVMKDFYTHFKNCFDKKEMYELNTMCFVLYEICNSIKEYKKIDVARLKSSKYNSYLDEIENKLKDYPYDFYEHASKGVSLENLVSLKSLDNYIYFYNNTGSYEKTFNIDDDMEFKNEEYDFNDDIFLINNKVLYYFYILSGASIIMNDIKDEEIIDSLEKYSRTKKRKIKSGGRSFEKVLSNVRDGRTRN